ncbi:MAG: hypothetical protein ACM3WU_01890 [Bacillota bacterium]
MVGNNTRDLSVSGNNTLARRVINDVMRLTYELNGGRGMHTPMCGALLAVMKRLGVETDYDFIACTSGAAFRMVWKDGWYPDNSSVMYMDEGLLEPVQQAFDALGYEYAVRMCNGFDAVFPVDQKTLARFPDTLCQDRAQAVAEIRKSIDDGIPVIAWGIVGPPEPCILTGYDNGGEVIIGTSYFQDDSAWRGDAITDTTGYFRKADWFRAMLGYIIIGPRKPAPGRRQLYLKSLRRAVSLARAASVNDRHAGLAAYDVLASQLASEDMANLGLPALWERFMSYIDALIMPYERGSAAAYLRRMALDEPDWAPELERAAVLYSRVEKAGDEPLTYVKMNNEGARKFADVALRRILADQLIQAREDDEQAIALIESLLSRIGG